jgi:hypothetical protein
MTVSALLGSSGAASGACRVPQIPLQVREIPEIGSTGSRAQLECLPAVMIPVAHRIAPLGLSLLTAHLLTTACAVSSSEFGNSFAQSSGGTVDVQNGVGGSIGLAVGGAGITINLGGTGSDATAPPVVEWPPKQCVPWSSGGWGGHDVANDQCQPGGGLRHDALGHRP